MTPALALPLAAVENLLQLAFVAFILFAGPVGRLLTRLAKAQEKKTGAAPKAPSPGQGPVITWKDLLEGRIEGRVPPPAQPEPEPWQESRGGGWEAEVPAHDSERSFVPAAPGMSRVPSEDDLETSGGDGEYVDGSLVASMQAEEAAAGHAHRVAVVRPRYQLGASALRRALRPGEVQRAVLLAEILGPPVTLRRDAQSGGPPLALS